MKGFARLLFSVILGLAGLVAVGVPIASHPASAAISADPSGQPMPVGDLPGWHQVFADNFANDNYPLGSFTGCHMTGCSGTPAVPWGAVEDGHPDTSGNCEYYPLKTWSITGGLMNIFLHTDPDGVCMDASLYPLVAPMTYGMYSIRFRADAVLGYKGVFFLWPVNGVSGEIDFPEANLQNPIHGFLHPIAGAAGAQGFVSNVSWNDWHTATLQWTPYSVTYILDGTPIGTTSIDVPQTPMTLTVRGESDLLGAPKPPASSQGNLQIAWATVYAYTGNADTIAVSPSTLAQGADASTVTITGPGFTSDSQVAFSSPDIVQTGPPTLVTSNEMQVPVEVSPSAALSSSDVTVTQASNSWTCKSCVTVTPGPGAISVTSDAEVGQTQPLTVEGTNLESGLKLSTPEAGVKFGPVTSLTSTSLTTTVSVSSKTASGAYDVTVTNPDGGSNTCAACLNIIGTPSAPIMETTAAGNGEVSVAFEPPPTDGGSTVTSYTATASDITDPSSGDLTRTGTRSPLTVPGLVNGNRYRLTVSATNAVGTGPDSTMSEPVAPATVPGAPTIGTVTAKNAKAVVDFSPPSTNGGESITGYTVTATDLTTPANGRQVQTAKWSPVSMTGLTNGDTYQFTVAANNADGTGPVSALSQPVVPGTVPGAPVIGSATAGSNSAVVSFSSPVSDGGLPIVDYVVTATDATTPTNGGQVQTVTSSPVTVTGLTNGDVYKFNVGAVNGVGPGPTSGKSNWVVPSTVPGAPTIGIVTAKNAKAVVDFSPPSTNGGDGISGYTVTATDLTTPANGGEVQMAKKSPVSMTGLTNGDTYQFTVAANNAVGAGPVSALSQPVVPGTVPGAPVIGSATAGSNSAVVTFSPPVSDGGSPIVDYVVTATDATTPTNGGQVQTVTSSPATITGLTNGDVYHFTVSATNVVGPGPKTDKSNWVVPSTVPGAPTIGIVTAKNAKAVVDFSPPTSDGGAAVSGYSVTATDLTTPANGGQVQSAKKSPVTMTGLTNGDTYQFTVTATNVSGTGPSSDQSDTVVPSSVPGAPGIPTAVAGNSSATVSFEAPSSDGGASVTGYTVTAIDISDPADGNQTTLGSGSPITVSGLTNGDKYRFFAKADNVSGTGAGSMWSNTVIPSTVAGAPAIESVVAGKGHATITFQPPATNGGAHITSYVITAIDDTDASNGGEVKTAYSYTTTITGLTGGDVYQFTINAANVNGTGPPSGTSNPVVPT